MTNSNNKYTVLLADENIDNINAAEECLKESFTVLKASNGLEVLKILNDDKNIISCILLNVDIKECEIDKIIQFINEDTKLKNIPLIISASHKSPEKELECLEGGAIDIISVPFNTLLLKRRLLNIVEFKEKSHVLKSIELDELTKVYTRPAFYVHAQNFIDTQDEEFDLIVTDIPDFKIINEKYGENKADELLIYTANFLKEYFAYENYIGRFGSDKFILLVKKDNKPTNVLVESKLYHYVESSPLPLARCKFGIYENVNKNLKLTLCANYTLTALKRIINDFNTAYIVFNDNERKHYEKQSRLASDMREGLEKKEFKVYYQPKHETNTGRLVGAEALIRWQHPELGFIPPNDFIPIFESNGFIPLVDFYVWTRTCENLRRWQDKGIEVVPISVNASNLDFDYKNYTSKIMEPVNKYNIDPHLLHIEITESINPNNIISLIEDLNKCRELGFEIELDDFGSGYSSLNVLGSLPLDVVKIDQSFIRQIDNPRKARILSSCLALSKNLGLISICEGVETKNQLNILKSLGCDRIQGYYFSKPLPEDEFEAYMIGQSKVKYESEYNHITDKTSAYMVDDEFNIVSFNQTLAKNFDKAKVGEKCYKAIHNNEEICKNCPIINKQVGPKTQVDMANNRFLILDCSEMPLPDGNDGYVITVGATKNLI